MAQVKNLGLVKAIHVGTTPPSNTNLIWYDNNTGVNFHKYYDVVGGVWVPLGDGEDPVYTGATPVTDSVGAIPVGFDPTGLTSLELWETALVSYQEPAFSSFSIQGQSSLIEVGMALSGIKTFLWGTSNPTNIQPNSIDVIDVNTSSVLASGLADDGTEDIDIGTVVNTSPVSQSYRIEGINTESDTFDRNTTINSIYPYFYGKVASGGSPSGGNRPVANQALIDSGTKVVQNSGGTITVDFNSTPDDYIWFAIPNTSTSKTVWYVNALNTGLIGGAVNPGGNLFPDFDLVSINSPDVLWNGVSYKIYISNFQSEVTDPMQLRNN